MRTKVDLNLKTELRRVMRARSVGKSLGILGHDNPLAVLDL